MARVIFAIPGDPSARTGGFGYDREVLAALPEFNVEVAHVSLKGSFPFPSEAEARDAAQKAINAALAPRDVALIDGLAYGLCCRKRRDPRDNGAGARAAPPSARVGAGSLSPAKRRRCCGARPRLSRSPRKNETSAQTRERH